VTRIHLPVPPPSSQPQPGRSSARETIGRVAAGAVAEKWLRETYGTEVVCFVSSVGTVDLPKEGLRRADGSPWTRAEVDTRGTLR
jgi:chorismate synthase